jgi:hypothetical protein
MFDWLGADLRMDTKKIRGYKRLHLLLKILLINLGSIVNIIS